METKYILFVLVKFHSRLYDWTSNSMICRSDNFEEKEHGGLAKNNLNFEVHT